MIKLIEHGMRIGNQFFLSNVQNKLMKLSRARDMIIFENQMFVTKNIVGKIVFVFMYLYLYRKMLSILMSLMFDDC